MRPATDPIAVRLHRQWTPYTHVRKPMRPAVRQQMYGSHIDPLVEFGRSIPSGKICVGIAVLVGVVFGHAFLGDAFGPRPRASHGAEFHRLHHTASAAIAVSSQEKEAGGQ
jgi:hypothetical protein